VKVFGHIAAIVDHNLRLPATKHRRPSGAATKPTLVLLALRTSPPTGNEPITIKVYVRLVKKRFQLGVILRLRDVG
jgi:hypothetical protein